MRITALIAALLLLLTLTTPVVADDFVALTGPYPPFSINKGIRVKGISVDTLVEMMKLTGTPFNAKNVKLMPWSRALQEAAFMPRRIILNVPRTSDVQDDFKWVGPIDTIRFALIGHKSDQLDIGSLRDAGKHKLASIRNSGPEKVALSEGVSENDLNRHLTHVRALRELSNREVDMFIHSDAATAYFMPGLGMNPEEFAVVHVFEETPLYFAFSKDVDDALIERLQAALDQLKQSGDYDKIVAKHLPRGRLRQFGE